MSRKDAIALEYLGDPRRFADLINAFFFHGAQQVKAEDVCELDGRSVHVEKKNGKVVTEERKPDLLRRIVCGVEFLLVHVEEQSQSDFGMPIRVMEYDSRQYSRQLKNWKKYHREKRDLSKEEWISGIKRKDSFYPVVTLVIYFGRHWNGPRSLHEMLNMTGMPENMIPYVNDYPVWILETGSYPALENFHTDLRVVLGFLQRATKKEEMWRWVKENKKEFQQLDEDAYDLIQVMANTKGLDVYVKKYQREGGKLDMCQAIEEMLEDERREGIEQGIEQGMERGIGVLLCFCREQGMEAEEIAEKLRRYGLTDQEILRYARKRIGKEKG